MRLTFMICSCLLPIGVFAQTAVEWMQPQRGFSIAADGQHNVFTVDYDYNPAGDITLSKRDPSGNLLWTAGYNQTDNSKWEKATWVATDNEGNALISGTLMSGYSNPVNAASILMKFSPDGVLLWRRVYESSFDGSYTRKCLVDDLNNVYVLGLGSGPGGFVTKVKKFGANGDSLWSYFNQDGIGAGLNIKFTPDGNILLIGRGTVGSVNGFAKLDRDGNHIWSLPLQYSLTVGDAAGDEWGNTYVVNGEYIANGGTVLQKLNAEGTQIWSNTFPTFSGNRVEVGTDGQPVMSGYPSVNSGGAAFMKADTSGQLVWSNLDADGALALLLHAQLRMDRQNNAYLAAGTLFEMAVCKVKSDGTSDWTITTPGSYANAFVIDEDFNVYVVGGYTVKIRQALTAPDVVYAFGEDCQSTLLWAPVAGANVYDVYVAAGQDSTWSFLGSTSDTTWPVGCEEFGVYRYHLVAAAR
ncbi:MAG: hypothetical protein H6508_08345 [Calditrichaeota bacterium]|nr:hypothetical protein [Calditrichota bacterium]MCB9367173.1 hypothetical protein [Calditrichota bacterium]